MNDLFFIGTCIITIIYCIAGICIIVDYLHERSKNG